MAEWIPGLLKSFKIPPLETVCTICSQKKGLSGIYRYFNNQSYGYVLVSDRVINILLSNDRANLFNKIKRLVLEL
jgi:hypothetical protein